MSTPFCCTFGREILRLEEENDTDDLQWRSEPYRDTRLDRS